MDLAVQTEERRDGLAEVRRIWREEDAVGCWVEGVEEWACLGGVVSWIFLLFQGNLSFGRRRTASDVVG